MLFKTRFLPGIRDGSITETWRDWKLARVVPGRRYRLAGGEIEVVALDRVALGEVSDADAKRAGFEDRAGLLAALGAGRSARRRVFRVRFRWCGDAPDPRAALREDVSAAALDALRERLDAMDRRCARGPWTRRVLRLIGDRPGVAASRLAPELDRETRAFKADVRKLKNLGLTISHEVGYELSPRGRALLAREARAASRR